MSETDRVRQREVIEAFVRASRAGDFEALLAVLDPDVVVRADFGAGRGTASGETRGAEAVARQALLFRHLAGGERPVLVNGAPGAVVFAGERPYAVLGISILDGRITRIDILADPERLARIDLSAFTPTR